MKKKNTRKKVEDRDNNAVKDHCYVAYMPKVDSNCSNRIGAAAEAFRNVGGQKKHNKTRSNKKKQKNGVSLQEVFANPEYHVDVGVLRDKIVFVDGGMKESTIPFTALDDATSKSLLILRIASKCLYVPKVKHHLGKGLITSHPNGQPVYISCPRAVSLDVTEFAEHDADELIESYEAAIKVSSNITRGANIKIESDCGSKYVCVGSAVKRAGKGVFEVHHAMKKLTLEKQNRIHRHMRQIESLFRRYMPSEAICQVRAAISLVDAPLFSTTDGKTSDIYQGFAIGKNVFLSAHDDKDFTYSAVTVLKKGRYTVADGIIAYFNFPRLGLAIPLRPGDVLFFDPKETHMISSRCNKEDDIYCLSFYLKSNIIGGNDNDNPLTEEERECLQHRLKRIKPNAL